MTETLEMAQLPRCEIADMPTKLQNLSRQQPDILLEWTITSSSLNQSISPKQLPVGFYGILFHCD